MNHSWNADRLLTRYFDTPIRLYLYGRILDLTNIKANYRNVRGADSKGKHHHLHKKHILFAFPVEKMPDVQPHIKMDVSIKNLKLKPENLIENGFRIDESELESVTGDNIVFVTRGGHVIHGELQAFDKYHLFMRVGNKVVLVYRHGLFNFNKETVPNLTETNAMRELRKKKPQEWVKASNLKKETVLQTKGNDRSEVRKKEHPERVEANRARKETVLGQTKTNDLHEVRKKRERWVEANRENNFEEGIKHLLTDLYPDNAHFIYELLQNAEDAGASEVRFVLTNGSAEFEHNGNLLFSVKDVEAITSIGVSNKKDDPTSIGKFGIGFKAVFAYTTTPEIESGEYHFRIRDMVVPDTEGLAPGALGERKTRFIFPFDNPEKSPDKARTEIEKNLRQLNENTLLFLSNIRKIEYHLPDGSGSGSLERREREQDKNRIEISVKRPEDLISTYTHYLRFQQHVSVRDEEDGALKEWRIAVAFGMKQTEDRSWKITPLDQGQVCIYFPAIKETSKLQFHLHAPFASTVARDSVRECPANTQLLNHLADLITESMSAIRDRGLLNVEFLAVLPNDRDNLSADYLPIQKQLIEAFNNEKLTPMKRGGHAPASGSYRGSPQLSDLIQDGDLARLLRKDNSQPLWIANPQQRNQREDNFLSMLDISEWTTRHFIEILDIQYDWVLGWLQGQSDVWHQQLYVLLANFLSSPYFSVARERKNKLSNLSIVRCIDGSYRTGSACHFFSDDIESDADLLSIAADLGAESKSSIKAEEDEHEEDFHYVARGIYSSGQNKDLQEKARDFLKTIGVREVDEAEQIKLILRQRYVCSTNRREPHHTQDLERFIALVDKEPNKAVLFSRYFIFELDNGHWGQPSNHAFVDSPYLDTGLTVYYETISKNSDDLKQALSPNYRKSGIAPERLGKFAEAVGAQTKLEVKEKKVPWDHPEGLQRFEGNECNTTRIDRDYTIPQFKQFLNQFSNNNAKLICARLIWYTMNFLDEKCLKASFRGNQLYPLRVGASSLVHNLRSATWVPQQSNGSISFVCPRNASREYLPEGFAWPKGYPHDAGEKWLEAVEFGKTTREKEAKYSRQNWLARELGFSSGDEAETMVEINNLLKEQGRSPDELLREFGIPKRRAERLTIELSDAEEKQYEIRARSIRSTRSTIDPHTPLREQYTKFNNMECQMCRQEMPFKKRSSDDDYFEAVEAFGKDYFPKEHEAQHLALCPECAAKYKEYVKKDRVARKSLYDLLKDSDEPEVRLELSDFAIRIWFDKKHWHDLKTVLHYYENVYESENSTD